MDHNKITKQLLEMNKTAFDNTFSSMTILQDNSERIFFRFVEKNPLFTDNSRNAATEYIQASRKRRTDLKSHLDESFAQVADYFMGGNLQNRDK